MSFEPRITLFIIVCGLFYALAAAMDDQLTFWWQGVLATILFIFTLEVIIYIINWCTRK